MDLRNFFTRKRVRAGSSRDSEDDEDVVPTTSTSDALAYNNFEASVCRSVCSKAQKRKLYKARLSYKKEWEQKYPWLYCDDPKQGKFCKLFQKQGNAPSTARGAWTSRRIQDWNHATEQLKEHSQSKCHRDAVIHARMAEQGKEQSVLQLQCSAAAKEAEERSAKNRNVVLKLLRSIYFLAKNRLPLTTTFDPLAQLQIANGDELLQHVKEGPQNAQYTSKFSAVMLLEAINSWLDMKLIESLKSSPYFSVLADECVDISTTEELSIFCRWIVNGKPEEHFLTVLHICAQDAATISDAISSFLESKNLEYHKLISQGYDGAATFAGECYGVQKRMRTLAAHSFYIHCACHRLQLASMQAANSVPEIKKMFGTMGNIWKLFFYSPKKAESLKAVQSVHKLAT